MNTMKKLVSMLMVLGLCAMASAAAFAQDGNPYNNTPRINQRQREQQRRIRQGVRSGELTRGETKSIEKQERDIQQDKRDAKADGVVTTQERREILHDQNQASRRIYRLKHNNRTRN